MDYRWREPPHARGLQSRLKMQEGTRFPSIVTIGTKMQEGTRFPSIFVRTKSLIKPNVYSQD